MKLKFVLFIEISLLIIAFLFAFLWIKYPSGKYEPYLVFIGFLFTGIEIYKNKVKQKESNKEKVYKFINTEPQRLATQPHQLNFINGLPEQRKIVYKNAKILWDSGITASMTQGSYDVLDFLIDTWVRLAEFYPQDHFENKDSREFISEYLKKQFNYFHSTGEEGVPLNYGTIEDVLITSKVNSHLENMIKQMVYNIAKNNDSFDFESWEKRWVKLPLQKTKSEIN